MKQHYILAIRLEPIIASSLYVLVLLAALHKLFVLNTLIPALPGFAAWHSGQVSFANVSLLKHSRCISCPHLNVIATLIFYLQHGHDLRTVGLVSCRWSPFALIEMQVWHVWQWKKFSRPPVLQTPQSSQWNYLLLVSLSNKLHMLQKYLPNVIPQNWQL